MSVLKNFGYAMALASAGVIATIPAAAETTKRQAAEVEREEALAGVPIVLTLLGGVLVSVILVVVASSSGDTSGSPQ